MNKANPTPFRTSSKSWQSVRSIWDFVFNKKVRIGICALAMIGLVYAVGILEWYRNQKNLKTHNIATMTMVDVGQGDGFVIDLPDGKRIAIDVGADAQKFFDGLEKIETVKNKSMSAIFGIHGLRKTIDLVILTHDDEDHAGALPELISKIQIGAVLKSPFKYSYIEKIKNNNVTAPKIIEVTRGFVLKTNTQKIADIYHPVISSMAGSAANEISNIRAQNEHSIIARFNINHHSILFTGDAGINEEKILMGQNDVLNSEFLKAGHHGSKTSTGISFLQKVQPRFALISAGDKNRYKHPHKSVLESLTAETSVEKIYRTDMCGTQSFTFFDNGAIALPSCVKSQVQGQSTPYASPKKKNTKGIPR